MAFLTRTLQDRSTSFEKVTCEVDVGFAVCAAAADVMAITPANPSRIGRNSANLIANLPR
jgi:hypothetical protein